MTATRTYSIGSTPVVERSTETGSNKVTALNTDVDGTADLEVNTISGAVTRRYTDPFGNSRGSAVTWSSSHGFLNAPTSAFSGLTQLGARAYDSLLGRFLSVDSVLAPENPLQNNGYAYAQNSPVANTDVTGLCAVDAGSGAGGQINCSGKPLPKPGNYPGKSGNHRIPPAAGNTDSSGPSFAGTARSATSSQVKEAETQFQLDALEAQNFQRPNLPWLEPAARWQYQNQASLDALFGTLVAGGSDSLGSDDSGNGTFVGDLSGSEVGIPTFIQDAASQAANNLGEGKGPVYGTKVHTEFERILNSREFENISTEVTYLHGSIAPNGTAGAVRLDVVIGPRIAPLAVYDLKTGSAKLTDARVAQIRSHLPANYQYIPILEVRP